MSDPLDRNALLALLALCVTAVVMTIVIAWAVTR